MMKKLLSFIILFLCLFVAAPHTGVIIGGKVAIGGRHLLGVNNPLGGIKKTKTTESNHRTTQQAQLLGETYQGSNNADGRIDDMRMFDYALTAAQINLVRMDVP